MCRAIEEGGRRCSGHGPSGGHRRAYEKAKRRKKAYKGPKEQPCPDCGRVPAQDGRKERKSVPGVRRWHDADGVLQSEVCDRCGGIGYLNDERTAFLERQREEAASPEVGLSGDDARYVFGEEGCYCPKCGSRADFDDAGQREFAATCLNSRCGHTFRSGFADPQCGNCREFLDDTDAVDDSLCDSCTGDGVLIDGEFVSHDDADADGDEEDAHSLIGQTEITEGWVSSQTLPRASWPGNGPA